VTVTIGELKGLKGTCLPGGDLVIEPYENAILEHAVRAPRSGEGLAHPLWFVVISLRCLGISVDELCELAGRGSKDTLLFGSCAIEQQAPLHVGAAYRAEAGIAAVGSRTTRDGSRLDNVDVLVRVVAEGGSTAGTVTSTYLFKRG
jgi:hypothetical protein